MIIYTTAYLATAPHVAVTIVYPDGATHTASVLVGGSLDCDTQRALVGCAGNIALSRTLDKLRAAHAAVGRAWAMPRVAP